LTEHVLTDVGSKVVVVAFPGHTLWLETELSKHELQKNEVKTQSSEARGSSNFCFSRMGH